MARLTVSLATAAGLCACASSGARPVPAQEAAAPSPDRPEDFEIGLASYRFDPREYQAVIPASLRIPETACDDVPCHYLVQFSRPLTPADRDMLTSEFGLRLQEYIRSHTYVEHLEPDARRALCAREPVRACVPYQPGFKLSADLRDPPHVLEGGHPAFLVVLFDTADPQQVSAELSTRGARVLSMSDNRALGGRIQINIAVQDIAQLEALAHLQEVRWIEKAARYDEDA